MIGNSVTTAGMVTNLKPAIQAYKYKDAQQVAACLVSIPVPVPTNSSIESIGKIVSGELDVEHGPIQSEREFEPGTHLQLLEDHNLHRKNEQLGITTRGVWLDWEGHKHKILPPLTASNFPEFLQGSLYQKKQGPSSGWKLREFRADIVPGMLSYTSKETNDKVVLWIMPGCIIQRINDKYDGRVGCIRILWPSGYDLILSTIDEEPSCNQWYQYLCGILAPAADFMRRRSALNNGLASALHRSAIRGQKSKESTPHGSSTHTRDTAKLSLRIRNSFSNEFPFRQDSFLFRELYMLHSEADQEASEEYMRWATDAKPQYNYAELPEMHYASCPATTSNSEAWESLISEFPDRHYEEVSF